MKNAVTIAAWVVACFAALFAVTIIGLNVETYAEHVNADPETMATIEQIRDVAESFVVMLFLFAAYWRYGR